MNTKQQGFSTVDGPLVAYGLNTIICKCYTNKDISSESSTQYILITLKKYPDSLCITLAFSMFMEK